MQISLVNIVIAFAGGLLSFLSPCVLPLVPGYISLMSGVSIDHLKGEGRGSSRRAVIANSLAFNAGLSVIFLALGGTAGLVGAAIINNIWVRVIGGLVIIIFGLHLIGLLKIKYLYKDTRQFSNEKPRGILGSLMLGIAFAAGWTPCIGPILGGIIGLAATSGGWKNGLVLSAFYAAGLALPFLLTGLVLHPFLRLYSLFPRPLHKVEVASRVLLIVIGLMVASNSLTWIAGFASRYLPNAESLVKQSGPDAGQKNQTTQQASNSGTSSNNVAAEPAPDVDLKTTDGKPLKLSDLRG